MTGLAFLASANALLESQAGVIDWNKAQLGVPFTRSIATAPSLHAPPRKSRLKTKAPPGEGMLISGTHSNVLGAVHANNGSVGRYAVVLYNARTIVDSRTVAQTNSMEVDIRTRRSYHWLSQT